MKTEKEICKAIVEKFLTEGCYETMERREVYDIYIMQREGFVVADYAIDSIKREYKATIKEVTACGKREFLRVPQPSGQGSVPVSMRQQIAMNAQLDNDKARDTALLHLASGGIALAFGIVSFLKRIEQGAFVLWVISVGLWLLSLLSLLVSFSTSRRMYDNDPSLCHSQQSSERHAVAKSANAWLNGFATWFFIAGLIVFTVFVMVKVKGIIK